MVADVTRWARGQEPASAALTRRWWQMRQRWASDATAVDTLSRGCSVCCMRQGTGKRLQVPSCEGIGTQ